MLEVISNALQSQQVIYMLVFGPDSVHDNLHILEPLIPMRRVEVSRHRGACPVIVDFGQRALTSMRPIAVDIRGGREMETKPQLAPSVVG